MEGAAVPALGERGVRRTFVSRARCKLATAASLLHRPLVHKRRRFGPYSTESRFWSARRRHWHCCEKKRRVAPINGPKRRRFGLTVSRLGAGRYYDMRYAPTTAERPDGGGGDAAVGRRTPPWIRPAVVLERILDPQSIDGVYLEYARKASAVRKCSERSLLLPALASPTPTPASPSQRRRK